MADEGTLPLVLLSHRGPVHFSRTPEGERSASRGSGGLVTALLGLAEHIPDAVWVCAADTEEDAAVVAEHGGHSVEVVTSSPPHLVAGEPDGPSICMRMVENDPEAHAMFYSVISNPLLWFIQHGLYGRAQSPVITAEDHRAFEDGYAAVNASFADAVAEEVEERGGRALVLIQDYHFYLAAERIRRRCPEAVLSHFVHIPWPGPDDWRILPPDLRQALVQGILGSDVVAFQTRQYAFNFVLCARELLGLPIDLDTLTITVGDRQVVARSYPISVDPQALEAVANSDEVREHAAALEEQFCSDEGALVVRVDRTDPSKNVVRGFLAFGTMLDQHPELVGRVSFLALLQPSRTDVPEYSDYISTIGAIVAEVNARHTYAGRQPIDLRLVEDFPLAVAAYSTCDVLMVNALADGMNLVAKEVAVVNHKDGVLALSETTGAFQELSEYAVALHPYDVQQQADALYAALTMAPEERGQRMAAARKQVYANDVRAWLEAQLADLSALVPDASMPPR